MSEPETPGTLSQVDREQDMAENAQAQTTAITRATRSRLALRERQRRALELRLAGHTYQQIADALGSKSKCGAYKAVEGALREVTREPAEAVRELELQRLDAMLAALWPQMQKSDIQALAGCLRISERRCRLLGLDAPHKIDATSSEQPIQFIVKLRPDELP